MGFKDFAINLGKSAVTSVANQGIGMGLDFIGNLINGGPNKMAEEQHKRELEKMDYQFALNKKAAEFSQEQALEMWEKTNYPAQVEQMKLAGLNPGLIYGKAGGGGTTTNGGGMQGVGQGTSAAIAMGLQLEQIRANTKLAQAQTNKIIAEAEKIAGADTENVETDTKLKESEIKLNQVTEDLKKAQENWTWADMYRVEAAAHELWQSARKMATDADIAEDTKEEQIEKIQQDALNSIITGMEIVSRVELNKIEKIYIKNQISAMWAEISIKEMTAEAMSSQARTAAERLIEDVKRWNKELNQKDIQILQDWIYRGINAGCQVSGEVRKWIYKGKN